MKKLLLSIILAAAFILKSEAQNSAFNNGNVFSVGIGVGTPYLGSAYSSSFPVNPNVTWERGVVDGISAGGELSYAGSKFYGLNVNVFYVGARAGYHLGQIVDIGKKADLYGGVGVGYVIVNINDGAGDSYTGQGGVGAAFYAGGRYYFTPATAIYAEVGYESLSYLNIGLAFKF